MSVNLIRANARNLPLADKSVDLIVTSPPYFGLRSYQDGGEHYTGQLGDEVTPAEFVDSLIECTKEMVRVLKPSGSIWINLGDKYSSGGRGSYDLDPGIREVSASRPRDGARPKTLLGLPWRYAIRCIDDLRLILRAEVIWSKPNGLPESVTDRVRRSHEQWFHLTVEPRYYSNVDAIRETHKSAPGREGAGALGGQKTLRPTGPNSGAYNATGALPTSVQTTATEPLVVPEELGVDHYAAFPTWWPRWIIQGWSPDEGVVLDPFGGTGTTALCADVLGRHGISADMSADYQRIARWRTTDPKQRAKAARTEYRPPVEVTDGQAAFDFTEGATA